MTRGALLAACALALLLGGCGLGEGERRTGVALRVTADFGARELEPRAPAEVRASDTVMRLLQRSYDVETRYGGGFVQSISGLAGGREDGRPVDWFYYLNGVEADQGAAAHRVGEGDAIWWDRHDWGSAMRVPAVVGSFPAPFVSSDEEGKRRPIRVDCAADTEAPCKAVVERLAEAGANRVGQGALNQAAGEGVIRVVVGAFDALRKERAVAALEDGPGASGVFARVGAGGIELLDARGEVTRTLGAGAGLVAATRVEDQLPTWIVTGLDDAGVNAAAEALTEERLAGRFALAVDGDDDVPLPDREAP